MPARVGPNAVIQLLNALDSHDPALCRRFAMRNGVSAYLETPPGEMVDEAIPARLFADLCVFLPEAGAESVAVEAGRLTADYVIENRIPAVAKMALRVLPRRVAARFLLRAIERNAWTFVGSGTCRVSTRFGPTISIVGTPLIMPGLIWHRAVFERLFRRLVWPQCSAQLVSEAEETPGSFRFAIDVGDGWRRASSVDLEKERACISP